MKAANTDDDSFEIMSDEGQMIGHATVFARKRIEVNSVQSYGAEYRQEDVDKMRIFAETEARSRGMLDD